MYQNRLLRFILCILSVCRAFTAAAQPSINYTQYIDNLTPLNHAFSLTQPDGVVNILARNQWMGVDGAPTLFIFNGSIPLKNINAATGIVATDNELGPEQAVEFNTFFAKSIQLNENLNLGVSLNAGFRYYASNYAALDPNDPAIQNDVRQFKPNAGFGVLLYSSNYYVGLSVPNLTIHQSINSLLDNNNYRNHYYLSAGYSAELDEDFTLKPATLLYYSRGVPFTADISSKLYIKETVGVGVNYRTTNDVAALFSVDFDLFHVGYSYQFGTSPANIGQFSNATHEIMLTFLFGRGNRVAINPNR